MSKKLKHDEVTRFFAFFFHKSDIQILQKGRKGKGKEGEKRVKTVDYVYSAAKCVRQSLLNFTNGIKDRVSELREL
jgi:hypothetical protein